MRTIIRGARTQRSKQLRTIAELLVHEVGVGQCVAVGAGTALARMGRDAGPRAGRVGELALSRYITANTVSSTPYSDCSLLAEPGDRRVMAGGGTWWQALLGMLVAVVRCSWCCSALGAPHRRRAVPPRRRQVASCSADHSWQDLPRSCPHVRLLRAGHSFSGPSTAAIRPTS